ncbi:MAG: hypothetical protein ABIQ86_17060 [Steroidobacteraceae bacterium]
MIDEDVHRLINREAMPDFDRLQDAIWAGVAERQDVRRVAVRQVAVMVAVTVVSVGAGFLSASTVRTAYAGSGTVAGAYLAPSQLLFGARQ